MESSCEIGRHNAPRVLAHVHEADVGDVERAVLEGLAGDARRAMLEHDARNARLQPLVERRRRQAQIQPDRLRGGRGRRPSRKRRARVASDERPRPSSIQ